VLGRLLLTHTPPQADEELFLVAMEHQIAEHKVLLCCRRPLMLLAAPLSSRAFLISEERPDA
jgi:hypothetical protein